MLVALRLVGRRRLLPAIYGAKEEWKYLCLPTVRAALPELTELFAPDFVGGLAGPALRGAAVEPSIGKRAERSLSTARPTRLSGAGPHSGTAAERCAIPAKPRLSEKRCDDPRLSEPTPQRYLIPAPLH